MSRATIFIFLCFLAAASPAQGLLDRITGSDSPLNLGSNQPEFLDPDSAFQFSYVEQNDRLRLTWTIAPGYYLYRERFKLAAPDDGDIKAIFADMPSGEIKDDPEFGRVEIYRDKVSLVAIVEDDNRAGKKIDLDVIYQGCAEDGICYPPLKKTVNAVITHSSKANQAVVPRDAAGPSENTAPTESSAILSADKLAGELAGRGILSTVAIFFGFGLLLSFTPCVFPMVPILSGIIVGQKQPVSTAKAFRLSLSYVLAMALTYATVGVVAGIFGHNLQATFQQPQWIIGFSVVFVLLALSMFGFYNLEIPQSWQTKLDQLSRSQSGGSYSGVVVMGILSAIIVGPCVAPPFAAALLYLSHQGSPLIGGVALFAMALGMGALLLIVGTASGRIVPRSGLWMENVKRFFGVLLLGVAIWFLGRVLPASLVMALWAALLIISAVYLGALESIDNAKPAATGQGWAHFKKGVGLIALAYGVVLIVGASAGAHDPFRPLAPLANRVSQSQESLPFVNIKSVEDLDRALQQAKNNGQITMLDFYADWCIECKHLEKNTFADASVKVALSEIVLLRADVTANDAVDQTLLKRFELFGPPAVLFFNNDGLEERTHRVVGFVGPDTFAKHLKSLKRS